ncbi:MAG: RNA pseudouridine synthase, partial [Muribaculaceae bacterium]|nr:RNA pseudouridine synthase [Muribaculaceae bacterium]
MTPRLHRLSRAAEAVEPPKAFTYPFCYTPHPLCVAAVEQICAFVQEQPALAQALDEGKMLGTLVVRDADGALGFLAAYSGNLSYDDASDFFVPAVFDFLNPNGYFK